MRSRVRKEKGIKILSVSQICNNFCVMCYEPKLLKDNPSLEELEKEILEMGPQKEVYLSGGEPTIRKDFFEIVSFIKKNYSKTRINLITNGRMLAYPSFVKKLKKSGINKIITEIHGSNERIHDKITQSKNSFDQTHRGILNVINYGIPIEIRIIINKINNKDLPKIGEFVSSNYSNLERVVIFPINIIGFAHKNKSRIAIQFKDTKKNVEKCIDFLTKKFEVKLFHYPFCAIDKNYWKHVEGITTNLNRISFGKKCSFCKMKKKCPRIWKTYLHTFGDKEFDPINDGK